MNCLIKLNDLECPQHRKDELIQKVKEALDSGENIKLFSGELDHNETVRFFKEWLKENQMDTVVVENSDPKEWDEKTLVINPLNGELTITALDMQGHSRKVTFAPKKFEDKAGFSENKDDIYLQTTNIQKFNDGKKVVALGDDKIKKKLQISEEEVARQNEMISKLTKKLETLDLDMRGLAQYYIDNKIKINDYISTEGFKAICLMLKAKSKH